LRSALRTLAVSAAPAVVIAVAWLRLESPVDNAGHALALTALALVPALVRPRAARVLSLLVACLIGAWVAFEVSPLHPWRLPGRVGSRFEHGFLDFYDVRTPFDPRVHAEMRGVVLAAVFGFVLAVAVAVAARRSIVSTLVFLVGAGWPATLRGPHGAMLVGVAILLAALGILAGLTTRRVPRAVVPAAAAVALAAVAASTSSALAKGEVVAWQRWDFYNAPQPPVSVAYVWDAQYDGIHFPRKRTTVLEIKAPPQSLYWRADILDTFAGDRWVEAAPKRADALEPASAATHLVRQDVRVLALSDTRLVGASVPLRYDAGDAPLVSRVPGIAVLPSGLTRDFHYTAWSYAPRPTARQLSRSVPDYPAQLTAPGTFLDVWPGVAAPPFASTGRGRRVAALFDAHPDLERYIPLAHAALAVAGAARGPYAAAAALESWFRATGGFRYSNRPFVYSPAPLVGFVAQTRAGYCQYFAGAMALMLRYLGVPARVAVGFSSGTYVARKHVWRVSDHDAHAWVEAWFRGYGWLPFDPTPEAGRPERGRLDAPYASAARGGGVGRVVRVGTAGSYNAVQSAHRHGDQVTSSNGAASTGRAAGSRDGNLLALLALLAGAAVAAVVAAKLAVRRVRYVTRDPRRTAAACRRELADFLVDQRIDAARSATLHELGALVRDELAVDPDLFVAAATAARFGPPSGAARAARQARHELRLLLRSARVRLSTRERLRGLMSLRSFGFAP
jgi:transglutaminase-like putative cysteine protease